MKFESIISETKAEGEQVWPAFDHNGDQLQLDPKWLDSSTMGPFGDYVFLIRVVSICDGCPFHSYQYPTVCVMLRSCELLLFVSCPLTAAESHICYLWHPHAVAWVMVCERNDWCPQSRMKLIPQWVEKSQKHWEKIGLSQRRLEFPSS